ncbi:hypothetical protein ACLQ28_26080 [Micromonospora sp. DT201]|uniref:hypothetical protein n=1 Tax=Micromonospora sp. DT201 TaxID=3393442 RepID=UPI003CF37B52
MRTSGKPLAGLVGVVLLGVGVLGLWRWGPLGDGEVVPSCGDLVKALPNAVDGSWALTRAEPNREVSRALVGCEFDFRSADQLYTGKVALDVSEVGDEAALRNKATDGPCYGEAVPYPSAAQYKVARSCSQMINAKVLAGVFVSSDERYAHILADFSGPNLPDAQVIAYANAGAQRIIDRAMALDASD